MILHMLTSFYKPSKVEFIPTYEIFAEIVGCCEEVKKICNDIQNFTTIILRMNEP